MNLASLREELIQKTLRIRLVEERIIELYPSDKIQSPVHLSIGQEAIAVGVCESLRTEDLVFCTYRSHAFYMAKGGDLHRMFAELYGKATGCCGGKAGSMHLAAPEVGLMGASAVVASTIPHAVGAAQAARLLNKDQVVVVVFGDGATDEGVYHESLNYAAIRSLPIIFLCENNGLAVHSRRESRQSFSILDHAATYGIATSYCHDGHDPLKVQESFKAVVEAAKTTGKPQFILIDTCRYMEHVGTGEDLDAGFRSRAEVDVWKAKDPLLQNPEIVARYQEIISREIDEAVAFAEASPWPGPEALLADVY